MEEDYDKKIKISMALICIELPVLIIIMSQTSIVNLITILFIILLILPTFAMGAVYDGKRYDYEEKKRRYEIIPPILKDVPEGRTDGERKSKLIQKLDPRMHYKVDLSNDEITGKCIVCDLSTQKSEEILACPRCFAVAHKMHLQEWLKVKGRCPNCNVLLKISDCIAK